jgi:hypothetical protein
MSGSRQGSGSSTWPGDGVQYAPADVSDLATIFEFDPATLVLTAPFFFPV